jgi:hypothetical protein
MVERSPIISDEHAPSSPALQVTGCRRDRAEGWVLVEIPKAVLVLTKAEFLQGLRRGKWWRHLHALERRRGS